MKRIEKYKKWLSMLTALGTATLAGVLCMAKETSKSLESVPVKKRVVFLTGDDLAHSSGSHEFYAGALLLKQSLQNGGYADSIEFSVVNNWPEDTSVFEGADLIVHYYRGNQYHFLNKNHAFIDALVQKGTSQMFIHFGVDPGAEAESSLRSWTGGVYKDGHSTNPHWTISSQLDSHPINNGVQKYRTRDEWYLNMDFEESPKIGDNKDPEIGKVYSVMRGANEDVENVRKAKKVLKANTSPTALTVFWAKESENGSRGVGVTGGHFHKNWANDEFRKQVLNAIVWGVKLKVPEEGVVSPKVTEEMINENLDKRKKGYRRITL